jgi:DNA-binding response OmpR family regulator
MRILLVEDEKDLSNAIKEGLEDNFFTVDQAFDGEEAIDKIEIERSYDLIIVDIMIPKIDGIKLLKMIREKEIKTPILMLTAKNGIDYKVNSFDLGADDYLTKPFDFRELLARIKSLIRRDKETKTNIIKIKNILIDTSKNKVYKNGKLIELTKKEYQILLYLSMNKGKIVSKEELENHLWDENSELWSDTLRTHVKNLRRKIEKKNENIIKTIKGIGFEIDEN